MHLDLIKLSNQKRKKLPQQIALNFNETLIFVFQDIKMQKFQISAKSDYWFLS